MRFFHVKMRGVFPPERAASLRPAYEALQARIDAKQEEIARPILERMRDIMLYGEPGDITPVGLLRGRPYLATIARKRADDVT